MKTRRILSSLLAVLMLVSTMTVGLTVQAKLPFNDTDGHWGESAIEYVVKEGLMNGVGNGSSFAPDMNLTRGMVVTVLYRDNGSPKDIFKGKFLDVAEGQYYTAAAEWAFENGIVNGTGTDEWGEPYFSPDRNITRQELATMFVRYAAFKHVDTTKKVEDISLYPDASSVASWATDAVKWAVGNGLITGKFDGCVGTLAPTDDATRAEFATIIMRFKQAESKFEYSLYYSAPVPTSTYTEPDYPLVKDADIYVAVDGDDKNPGTLEKPLATFEAAKAKVRTIKAGKTGEIKVAFKAGNYGVLDNVIFTPDDSGNENLTITYCAFGDGDVVFQNGILLKEGDFTPVDESDHYLLGAVDKSKIYKIDLTGKIDSFTDKNIVFSSTGMCHEARIPNKRIGVQEHAYWNVTTTYNETESILLQSYLPGIVKEFRTVEGMKVTGMLRTGWLVDTFPVKSFDPDTGVLTFDFENCTFDNGYTLEDFVLAEEGRMDDYVFFHNLSDQIDSEGEYWFDPKTSILYMYLPVGDYYIGTDGRFISMIEDTEHISFVGLDFLATMDSAIDMDANHITFDQCTFGNVAGAGCIRTEWGYRVNNITVTNCEFFNFYDKGVDLFSSWPDLATMTPSHIVISNNYFHDFSSPQTFGAAVNLTNIVGAEVSHNEFVNGAHAGISFGSCMDLMIEYNVLDNMMNSTIDYGAIYNFNTIVHRGNVVRYNIIKNIRTVGGAYGVYIDGSFDQEIYGNIFYNAGDRDVVSNGGRENNIHDNISIRTKGYSGDFMLYNFGCSEYDEDGNFKVNDTIVSGTFSEINYHLPKDGTPEAELWKERWPILYNYSSDPADIDKFECILRTVNTLKDNTLIGTGFDPGKAYEVYGEGGNNIEYSLDENKFFVNPTLGDYTLRDGVSIHKIPYDKIGRY